MKELPPTTSSKKFAIAFIATFVLMLIGVTVLHVLGNPDQLFASPLVPSHAQRSWKSRRLQALIDENKKPQVVVLGSSRMRQVSPKQIEAITGLSAFNYAVGGASCIESLAQARSLIHRGIVPKILIVGVDERALLGMYEAHVGHGTEDMYLFRELPFKEKLHHTGMAFTEISLLRTPAAISNLISGPELEKDRITSNFVIDDGYMVDFSHTIRRKNAGPMKPAQLIKQIINASRTELKRAQKFYARQSIDRDQIKALRDIAALCKANKIQLKLLATPLQPDFFKAIKSPKMRARLETAFKQLKTMCRNMKFDFVDCRTITSFNGDPVEFWDPWHVSPVNMMRMVNRLFDVDPMTRHEKVPTDEELIAHPPAISSLNIW